MKRKSFDPVKGLFIVVGLLIPLLLLCMIHLGGNSGAEYRKKRYCGALQGSKGGKAGRSTVAQSGLRKR